MCTGNAAERAAGEVSAPRPRPLRRDLVLGATLLLSFVYFFPKAGWNENSRFDLVRAIVDNGSFSIDPFHMNTGDKASVGGRFLSDKAPGASFVAVLPYTVYRAWLGLTGQPRPRARVVRVGGGPARGPLRQDRILVNWAFIAALYICGIFAASIPGVLIGVLLNRYGRAYGLSARPALGCAAIYSLGTIAFPYSTALYGHQLAAGCLFGAFFLGQRARSLAPAELYFAGALVAWASISEYPASVAGLGIIAWALWRGRSALGVGRAGAGAAPVLALNAYYAWRAFGSPWSLGYGHLAHPKFAAGQGKGLFGVSYPRPGALLGSLFGRHRGLLYVSPVLALAPWGWVRLWRAHAERRAELALCAAIALYFILLNASYYMWTGGAASGPRHVVPMLPFLCVGLFGLMRGRARWIVWALAVPSVGNALALTAAGVAAPEHGDLLRDYAWPTVLGRRGGARMSLGGALGLPLPYALLPLLATWACAAFVAPWPVGD